MPGFKNQYPWSEPDFFTMVLKISFQTERECLETFQRNVNMHLDLMACVQAKFQLEYLLFSTSFQDFSGTFLCVLLKFTHWCGVVRLQKFLSPGEAEVGKIISQ